MNKRRVLLGTACVLAVLGVVGFAGHLGVLSEVAALPLVVPAVLLAGLAKALGLPRAGMGVLWDAAHGPPFLTVAGVILIYFLPSAVLVLASWSSAPADAGPGAGK
jgi:hypothetical protein